MITTIYTQSSTVYAVELCHLLLLARTWLFIIISRPLCTSAGWRKFRLVVFYEPFEVPVKLIVSKRDGLF